MGDLVLLLYMAVVVKPNKIPFWGRCTNGIPFWLVGEFTTQFKTYFSGWIESDVHWGYGLFGF